MTSSSISTWLTIKFLEWQKQSGERRSVTDFAKWLGIPRSILSHYMNGRNKPTGENVDKIAAKLGPEIYDLLGLARPDPIYDELHKLFYQMTGEQRARYLDLGGDILSEE